MSEWVDVISEAALAVGEETELHGVSCGVGMPRGGQRALIYTGLGNVGGGVCHFSASSRFHRR